MSRPDRLQQLYRAFDASGRLLYVGISINALGRFAQHKVRAEWWRDVATLTVENIEGGRAKAEMRERHVIESERPLHNVKSNLNRPPVEPDRLWDPAPLVARSCMPAADLARRLGIDKGLLAAPLSDRDADMICTRLRLHPREVWPSWGRVSA